MFWLLIARIAFIDPINFYIMLKIEQFIIGEFHFCQELKCRTDIRAMFKWAITAIDHNVSILWKLLTCSFSLSRFAFSFVSPISIDPLIYAEGPMLNM